MKKNLRKFVLVLAVAMLLTVLIGCASGPSNPACLGVWGHSGGAAALVGHYSFLDPSHLLMSISDSIAIFDDKTFILVADYTVDYKNDEVYPWFPINVGTTVYYGTYEVVSTDADLGETVIKIVSVDRVKGATYDSASAEYANAEDDVKQGVDTSKQLLPGTEFTLGAYGNLTGDYTQVILTPQS